MPLTSQAASAFRDRSVSMHDSRLAGSPDKFRSAEEEEEKHFNYKQFSLAYRTLNLSKSQTSDPLQDGHLLLLWQPGWGAAHASSHTEREFGAKCLVLRRP